MGVVIEEFEAVAMEPPREPPPAAAPARAAALDPEAVRTLLRREAERHDRLVTD